MQSVEQLKELHLRRFGTVPQVFAAPGRVNLIGEHTDYAEGFVMPAAIDFATLAGVTQREDGRVVIRAENFDEERSFEAEALPEMRSGEWSDYPVGVLRTLAEEGYRIPPLSLSLWGDVPLGSGLSSSASVEVATAAAVTRLMGTAIDGPAMARLCQRAENEFVGASCGIMDQFVSVNGAANHALLRDCRDLSYRLAPIPKSVALVIANTMVKHSIAGGGIRNAARRGGTGLPDSGQAQAGDTLPERCNGGGSGTLGRRDSGSRQKTRAAHYYRKRTDDGGSRSAGNTGHGPAGNANARGAPELQP